VSGHFATKKMSRNVHFALLAGTVMLPSLALAQAATGPGAVKGTIPASVVAQPAAGAIILAQATPTDPNAKPQPKGAQPKGNQPPAKGPPGTPPAAARPQGPQGQANTPATAAPTQAAPTQRLNVPPKGVQPAQGSAQPGGPPAGAPNNAAPAQPRQFGVQPNRAQPQQGNAAPANAAPTNAAPTGTPAINPSTAVPAQPRQFGTPAPATGQQTVLPGAKALPTPNAGPAASQPAPSSIPGRAVVVPQTAQPAALTGNVNQLHQQRQERRDASGRVVIEEPGRVIVREGNTVIIRHDEAARFSVWGAPRLERRGGEQFAHVTRPGGYEIITVTGPDGRLLRRIRRGPDGREVILIDNRVGPGFATGLAVGATAGFFLGLAAPAITIPRERYIVDVSAAPAPLLYETLDAPPLVDIERAYSLDEIKYNVELRDRMRRIDIDSVTFDTGSWEVTPEQQPKLQAVADAMQRILSARPDEVFLIEGHTDAIGNDVDNLSLSDRRAESVAVILTNAYQIAPENLVTQGYGAQNLKIQTDGPSRENRRVTVRRITPLLQGRVAGR
jgi:outer membrane protein OmpA-like peptidoglycan-associated protein